MNKILAIPDPHVPYHDMKSIRLMVKVAKDIGVDTVVLLGDVVDCYSISSFEKHPLKAQFLQDEIDDANKFLDYLDKQFPQARKIYCIGNHEYRLEKALIRDARALYGTLSIERMLRLSERKYEVVRRYQHKAIGKLLFAHGDTVGGKHFAWGLLQKYGKSICVGHHHRIQSVERRIMGTRLVAFSPGTMADIEAACEYIKGPADMHTGFATILMLDNGDFFHQIHPIIKGKTFAWGKLYKL